MKTDEEKVYQQIVENVLTLFESRTNQKYTTITVE